MTWTNNTRSKTWRSAKLAAGLAISAAVVLVAIAGPADARWRGRGGYYAPPVVYGGSYYSGYGYYPPPVVYPGIAIGVPGISIGLW